MAKKTRVWKIGLRNNFVKLLIRNTERKKIRLLQLIRFVMNSSRPSKPKSTQSKTQIFMVFIKFLGMVGSGNVPKVQTVNIDIFYLKDLSWNRRRRP